MIIIIIIIIIIILRLTFDYLLVLEVKLKSLSLSKILSLNSTWLMNCAQAFRIFDKLFEIVCRLRFSWTGVWTYYCYCQAELGHSLLDLIWLQPWTSWSSTYTSIFFPSVFSEYDQDILNLRFCSLCWNIFIFFYCLCFVVCLVIYQDVL